MAIRPDKDGYLAVIHFSPGFFCFFNGVDYTFFVRIMDLVDDPESKVEDLEAILSEFNDYWLGALLHDIGKLVLGFFFQQRFADVVRQQEAGKTLFRKAETQLGDVGSHEQTAQLFLLKAQVGSEMVAAPSP